MRDENVIESVRDEVEPSHEEMKNMEAASSDIQNRIQSELDKRNISAEIVQTGSTARGTWVSGDRDIDIFIQFPTNFTVEELEEVGTEIGKSVLPNPRLDFASHPYVKGEYNGFDVDIVPCFGVEDAAEIKSAVDRTPFHTKFLQSELDSDLKSDVRVAKKFLKGIGAYGSDVATRGFSGFLTELLILDSGGFIPLLENVSEWKPPVRIDFHGNGETGFNGPLVIIDPTDPGRNVASALSEEKFALFQHKARRFLSERNRDFFAKQKETINSTEVKEEIENRGSCFVALLFDSPINKHRETVIPQLKKSTNSIHNTLEDSGFRVIDSHILKSKDKIGSLFELENGNLSNYKIVRGPPVSMEKNAEEFWKKYSGDESVIGPFIKGDRFVVRKERENDTVAEELQDPNLIERISLGPVIENQFSKSEVMKGEEIYELANVFPEDMNRVLRPKE